ncbi:CC50B protein, partial [Atractosteus spatula]|nr:CC50B protein [Atractosteus spatula]
MKKEGENANKPDNTAFTQQRLPAWQPILSAGIVIPGFVIIGLAFIAIGVALFLTSKNIQVLEMDYTGTDTGSPCSKCTYNVSCKCLLSFQLDKLFEGPVFFYYGLSNYYQNYRKYGVSRDDYQLFGYISNLKNPGNYCSPFQYDPTGQPIAPCGAIANSFFNDSFRLFHNVDGVDMEVPLDGKGISWWSDYNVKFRNPELTNGTLKDTFKGTVKPLNWVKPAYELDTNVNNNAFLNQDFLVWMRTAALPNFRKLYRRITKGNYSSGLPAGNYSLEISYNYPVAIFQGQKKVVFSNVSWMGGKNEFLGIAYLVIGSLCIVMSVVMLIVYAKFQVPDEDL